MRKQVPIRIDEELLKEIKLMLVREDKSFQDYVISLIIKDMKENDNYENKR
ncbi:MAG: hypothetical protein ACRDB0_06845 [Paraclostridium sp.]